MKLFNNHRIYNCLEEHIGSLEVMDEVYVGFRQVIDRPLSMRELVDIARLVQELNTKRPTNIRFVTNSRR